jgi:hypothetical protein
MVCVLLVEKIATTHYSPFSIKCYDYEKDKEADFNWDEEEPFASDL